jgi:hypothetical protein
MESVYFLASAGEVIFTPGVALKFGVVCQNHLSCFGRSLKPNCILLSCSKCSIIMHDELELTLRIMFV